MRFYKEVLGLTEVRRGDMTKYGTGIRVLLQDAGTREKLELNWYPSGSPFAVPYFPREGLDHIVFQVEDVKESYRELLAKGEEAARVGPELTDGRQAYLKAPDGNWIELYKGGLQRDRA